MEHGRPRLWMAKRSPMARSRSHGLKAVALQVDNVYFRLRDEESHGLKVVLFNRLWLFKRPWLVATRDSPLYSRAWHNL